VGLTERQQEAVAVLDTPRDTCVVAGPGSGKTTVLVAYFAQLVESGVDPSRILAITFTDKAANNMRERLVEAFRSRPEIRGKLERAYVSTVDGFCTRLLKENAVFAGIDPGFHVMDERQSLRAQRVAVDAALDSMFAERPDRMRAMMRGLATTDAGAEVLGVYDAVRAAGIAIADLSRFAAPPPINVSSEIEEMRKQPRNQQPRAWRLDQWAHLQEAQDWLERIAAALPLGAEAALRAIESFTPDLRKLKTGNSIYDLLKKFKQSSQPELEYSLISEYYTDARTTTLDLLQRFDRTYREGKHQLGALDYGDLEECAVRLLEDHPEVRRRVQNQFDQVLMDELQDTNGLQARLLELLRAPNRFYAVGDINQSIYGFRHANPDVFRAYRHAVAAGNGRLVELVENFRSRPDILRAVEVVTDGASGIETRRLVPGLVFPAKSEPSVEVLAATTPKLEAQWVAARIAELENRLRLRDRTAEFRDFAVLVRNSEVLAEFTSAFDDCAIPYVVNRGKGFYETREIVDLMLLLRVVVNPRDEVGTAGVLRSPFVGVSDEALFRLKLLGNLGAALEGLTAEELAGFAPDDAAKLAHFRDRLAPWRTERDYTGIDRLLLRALDDSGYAGFADARAAANIEKFLAQARAAGARQTLAEFVDEIELLRESQPREPDAPPEDSANAVKIMTVHAAKGLEFPVVFLAALNKGIDSSPGAISFSPHIGLGANWHHPLGGKDKSDSFRHLIKEELKQREKEEGHRLLYVAMTRAEDHLVLSFSTNRKKPQNWAAVLTDNLGLNLEAPCDRIVNVAARGNAAPGGEHFPLRVRVVDAPPGRPAPRARDQAAASGSLVERPALIGQYDSQANVTSIAMFADCPRRYYLSRYLGFEPIRPAGAVADSSSAPGASGLGQQVHALLAGAPVESPDLEAAKLVETFRRSALGKRATAAVTIEREFDFLMEVEGVVLRGQIDLWFEDRGQIVLVDYKTDRNIHAVRYGLQLRLYGLALERLTGRAPAEAYLCFLRADTAVPVDLSPSLFDSPELAVREFRDAQERQHFPLREGEHCRSCPHFTQLCPARLASASPASPNPA
jgi:ATP-dependent helicase/nuclease subunit A